MYNLIFKIGLARLKIALVYILLLYKADRRNTKRKYFNGIGANATGKIIVEIEHRNIHGERNNGAFQQPSCTFHISDAASTRLKNVIKSVCVARE